MFVVTGWVRAANSEGVQCSGVSSIAKRFIQCVIQSLEHPAPTELNRIVAVEGYKHCIPRGFFVQLNNSSQENKNT